MKWWENILHANKKPKKEKKKRSSHPIDSATETVKIDKEGPYEMIKGGNPIGRCDYK